MRRKPSASHWVKNESLLTYRPISLVFLAGLQVVKISRSKASGPSGRFSSTSWLPSILNEVPWPLTSTRARLSSSPSRRRAWAATSVLRRRRILLSTRVFPDRGRTSVQRCRSSTRERCSLHGGWPWLVLLASCVFSCGPGCRLGLVGSDALLERGFDEGIQVAVQHLLGVGDFDVGAQVLDAALVQHVRADLVAPAHIGLAVFELLLFFLAFAHLVVVQARAQALPGHV